jgi:hypothetical protein
MSIPEAIGFSFYVYIYIISRIYDLAASLHSCLYHAAIQAKSQQQQQKQELNMR